MSVCKEEGKDIAIITHTEPSDLGVYCILEEEMGAILEPDWDVKKSSIKNFKGGFSTTTTTTSYIKRGPRDVLNVLFWMLEPDRHRL